MELRIQLELKNRYRYRTIITKSPDCTHLEANWSLHKSNHSFRELMPADWILSKLAWQCHRCHFKWGLNIYSFWSSLAYVNPSHLPLVRGKCHLALPSLPFVFQPFSNSHKTCQSFNQAERFQISLNFSGHWLDYKLCQKCIQFGKIWRLCWMIYCSEVRRVCGCLQIHLALIDWVLHLDIISSVHARRQM